MASDFEIMVRIFMSGIALLAGLLISLLDTALGCLVMGAAGAVFISAAIENCKTERSEYHGAR